MSSAGLDISVIICAYTEARWHNLVAAVASMQNQTLQPGEVIVVVDHNPDLLERVRAQLEDVIAIENSEPAGLSGARNCGIAAARGEVIAFIDEDAIAAPDWLAQLTAGYQDPVVIGTGGEILPCWLEGQPSWFPEEFNWVVGCTYMGLPRSTSPVRNLIGCNMSYRRLVFESIGSFRNGIGRIGTRPLGCEETEFCIRAGQYFPLGVLLFEPRARVKHTVTPQRASWKYFFQRCYAEGLSKALVSHLVGPAQSLSNERHYTIHTLPKGIVRGLVDALLHRRLAGFARAAAITLGLAVTTAGYLKGLVSGWRISGEEKDRFWKAIVLGNRVK